MKKLIPLFFISLLVASCCDCYGPMPYIHLEFKGFSGKELESINYTASNYQGTITDFVDTIDSTASLLISANSVHHIKSDSFAFDRKIEVTNYDREVGGAPLCSCLTGGTISFLYKGNLYVRTFDRQNETEPLVIHK